jgi:thiol-disulfide isomerase/thioredoxin
MRPNLQSTIGLVLSLVVFLSTVNAKAQGYEVLPWPAARTAPTTTGIDFQGNPQTWLPLRGKAVLINFWASWCEPCVAELPSLQALTNQYGADTLVVLEVNFKESAPTVQRFMSRTAMPTAVSLDRDGSVARAWGVNVFPTTMLIGADGQVKSWVRGSLDWQSPTGIALIAPLLPARTR